MFKHQRAKSIITVIVMLMQIASIPLASASSLGVGNSPVNSASKSPSGIKPILATMPPSWANVDWDSKVLLPNDLDVYRKQVDELIRTRKTGDIEKLNKKLTPMSDSLAMDHFGVPNEVRKVVNSFTQDGSKSVTDKLKLTHSLEDISFTLPALNMPIGPMLPQDSMPQVKFTDGKNKLFKNLIPVGALNNSNRSANVTTIGAPPIAGTPTPNYSFMDLKAIKPAQSIKSQLEKIKLYLIPPAKAQAANPLITFYQGIQYNSQDNALYYLSLNQNDDGSFGEENIYATTADVIDALARFGRTNNDVFQSALEYLTGHETENNEEKAIKIRVLSATGQNYDALLNELVSAKNSDGGYGFDINFGSDPLTTIEVLDTFTAINYNRDNAPALAIAYLANKIDAGGTIAFSPDSTPSFYLISRALFALYPYRNMVLANGANNILITDKTTALLSVLSETFGIDEGHMLGTEDLTDEAVTARAFELYDTEPEKLNSIKEYLHDQQSGNGDFAANIQTTIESMRILAQPDVELVSAVAQGNLVNKAPTQFLLTFRNNGYKTTSRIDLNTFADGVYFLKNTNIEAAGLVIPPNTSANLVFNCVDTSTLIGQTNLKFFVEPEGDTNYDNNWKSIDVNFAAAPGNVPSLPVYFSANAYDNNGSAGLTVRWGKKDDPNRLNYVVMVSPHGTNNWSYFARSNNDESLLLWGGLNEGALYDVTVGSLHIDGQTVTYFNQPIVVKVSNQTSRYAGTVNAYTTLDNQRISEIQTEGQGVSGESNFDGDIVFQNAPNGTSVVWSDYAWLEKLITKFNIPANGITNDVRIFTHLKEDLQAPVLNDFRMGWNMTVNNQTDRFMQFSGTDNAGIKSADIYYWDPRISVWSFVKNIDTQGQNSGAYTWRIPADLVGDGFKLRAIAKDYRGNKSLPREWGPFHINDGTPPQFVVTSPNGGESWALGSTQSVTWTTQAAHQVSHVNIRLTYPSGSSYDLINGVNNTGTYSWNMPLNGSLTGSGIRIEVSGSDDVTGIYNSDLSDAIFSITDPSPLPSAPWSPPVKMTDVSQLTPSYGNIYQVVSQYDTSGNLHVIYNYIKDQISANNRVVTEELIYAKKENGIWSNPTTIYQREFNTDLNLTGYEPVQSLKMAVDTNMNPHLIWQRGESGGCEANNQVEIMSMQFDGNNWSAPENISNNITYSSWPDLTVDAQNNVRVVWLDGITFNAGVCSTNGSYSMRYKIRNSAGQWQNEQQLNQTQFPSYPRIVTTANGTVHIVYGDGSASDVKHIMSAANGWTNPVEVVARSVSVPDLRAGPNNSLHYGYYEWYQDPAGQGRQRVMYSEFTANMWQPPVEISPIQQGWWPDYPTVFAEANGDPNIIFQYHGGNNKYYVMWANRKNNVWSVPKILSLDSQYIDNGKTSVSFDGVKNTTALWITPQSLVNEIFTTSADLTSDYTPPSAVLNLHVAALQGPVRLTWTRYLNSAGDFDHFNIYRSTLAGTAIGLQPLASLSDVAAVSYSDAHPTAGQSYYYAITAIDKYGNEDKNVVLKGPALALPYSLVTDGTMEALDLSSWQNWGVPNIKEKTRAQASSGAQSLHVDARIGGGGGVQQTNVQVQAGKTYRLLYKYKLLSGELRTNLGIATSNTDFEAKGAVLNSVSQSWQTYSRIFTMPQNFVNDFRVVFPLRAGEVYIDDVLLEEVPATLIYDSDMEANNLLGWTNWGSPTLKEKSHDQSASGIQSLHLDTRVSLGGGAQQVNLPVRSGHTYKLSLQYKLLSGGLSVLMGIHDSNADYENKKANLGLSSPNWQTYTRTFTVPSNFLTDFRLVFPTNKANVYLDDVKLEELAISDGNMELADVSDWQSWGTPGVKEKSAVESVSPTRSLHIDTRISGGGGVQQMNMNLIGGHTYQYTFKYKLLSGQLYSLLGNRNSNSDFENKKAKLAVVGNIWQN